MHFGDSDEEELKEDDDEDPEKKNVEVLVTTDKTVDNEDESLNEMDEEYDPYHPEIIYTKDTVKKTKCIQLMTSLSGAEIRELPSHVDDACQWDCEPFEGVPYFAVKHYSEKKKRPFTVYGNFCSPECTKASAKDSETFKRFNIFITGPSHSHGRKPASSATLLVEDALKEGLQDSHVDSHPTSSSKRDAQEIQFYIWNFNRRV